MPDETLAPLGVTMADVARAAQVSRATVSRVLSGSDLVVDRTRERVLDAVHRLGYLPNTAAQQLAGSATSLVGLLLRDPRVPAYGMLYAHLQAAVDAAGLQLITATPGPQADHAVETARLRQLLGLRVGGLFIASGVVGSHALAPFRSVVPLVSIGRPESDESIFAVSYDEARNGEMLADQIADHGHRRVATFDVPRRSP